MHICIKDELLTDIYIMSRSLMMRMTHIPTLTLQAYSDGATRLGWREWNEIRKRRKKSRKEWKSMNI